MPGYGTAPIRENISFTICPSPVIRHCEKEKEEEIRERGGVTKRWGLTNKRKASAAVCGDFLMKFLMV